MYMDFTPNGISGARKHRRAAFSVPCKVRQGMRAWTVVRLDDFSASGFRIGWLPWCNPDIPIRVRIPGIAPLSARVLWQQGKMVGCAFDEPLHPAVFDHLVEQAPPPLAA